MRPLSCFCMYFCAISSPDIDIFSSRPMDLFSAYISVSVYLSVCMLRWIPWWRQIRLCVSTKIVKGANALGAVAGSSSKVSSSPASVAPAAAFFLRSVRKVVRHFIFICSPLSFVLCSSYVQP